MSTVSLIDPTTLNPSFSGPDNTNRRGPPLSRPAAIITRNDQEASVELLTNLLVHAKQYRLKMLELSKAAANFGHSLEKIAHCKTAVMENPTSTTVVPPRQEQLDEDGLLGSSSAVSLATTTTQQPVIGHVGSCLQAAAGLHFLISNHHQILSDTLYKQFEIPLLQHLDTHKSNIEASEAQYERSMREMSQKIKDTEAASLQNGRKRQRDLLQFRQALMTLTSQVDELERIKIGYYFSNLESEQTNLQLILQKTSTLVRAEVDIYERVANKGLNDPVLELMTTQGPDPYCVYPTTDEFSSIFSILPPTPIIPTNTGNPSSSPSGSATTQPEGILTTFYGYHESNPFSTSRTQQTPTVPRDRHLFGEASSVESSSSPIAKALSGGRGAPSTSIPAVTGAGMMKGPSKKKILEENDADSGRKTSSDGETPKPEDTIAAIETSTSTSHDDNEVVKKDDNNHGAVAQAMKTPEIGGKAPDATNDADDNYFHHHAGGRVSDSQASSLQTDGLHHHHRLYSSKVDDSPGPSSSVSTQSSMMRPYTLRSLSGSHHHMTLASTPESYPTRNMIHIPQDSELLNNRDFSFSYDPTDLLDRRSHAGVHAGHDFINEFEGMERAPISAYTVNETATVTTTSTTTASSLHRESMSHTSSTDISHADSQVTHDSEERHQSSSPQASVTDKQKSTSSQQTMLDLPSPPREGEGSVAPGPERQQVDDSYPINDVEAEEDPYLHSLEHESKTARISQRVASREFDDGMPAFLSDNDDDNDVLNINSNTYGSSVKEDRDETQSQKSLGSKRSNDTFRLSGFFRSNNNSTTDVVERLLVQAN